MKKLLAFLFPLLMFSCVHTSKVGGGLEIGKAMEGKELEGGAMLLNGDTFPIYKNLSYDSLWVIYHQSIPADPTPYYVVSLKPNGNYYVEIGGKRLSIVEGSHRYVGKDDSILYDMNRREVVLTTSVNTCLLSLLGEWNGLEVFVNNDSLLFSDGKIVPLQPNVDCYLPKDSEVLEVKTGAYRQDVSLKYLHDVTIHPMDENQSVEKVSTSVVFNPRRPNDHKEKDGPEQTVLRLDLEFPKGQTPADQAVREWMQKEIIADLAIEFPKGLQRPIVKSRTLKETKASLNKVVAWWKKNFSRDLKKDTIDGETDIQFRVKRVADCEDYTTYFYYNCVFEGSWNYLLHSYYITYDKCQNRFLNAENTINPNSKSQFRQKALECLKDMFHYLSWEEFTHDIFSYHSSFYEDEYEKRKKYNQPLTPLSQMYECDGWAGWKGYQEKPFTESDFPLTHLALLPEGVALSYHPSQIASRTDGDFHVLIPYDKVKDYLNVSYSKVSGINPGLQKFFRFRSE